MQCLLKGESKSGSVCVQLGADGGGNGEWRVVFGERDELGDYGQFILIIRTVKNGLETGCEVTWKGELGEFPMSGNKKVSLVDYLGS